MFKSKIIFEKIIKNLSNDLNISSEILLSDYNRNTDLNKINELTKKENDKIIKEANKKGNKRFEYSLKKYSISERKLLLASYNSKKNCFEIENLLENHYFDEINRNLLFKILTFYKTNDIMNHNELQNNLTDSEKDRLKSIIEEENMPNQKEIKVLINNIKMWPYDKVINILNNKEEKTSDDLARIAEYKRQTTIINKNKE